MGEFFLSIAETIAGGLVLTVVLFFLNEFAFSKRNLTGEWKAILEIKETTYKPFENLSMEFIIHLLQKGYELTGSGEKVKDINPDKKETVFEYKSRTLISINGYYERKYIKKTKVYLNINEEGKERETRSTYILTLINNKTMSGNFISTAANARGTVEMKRS